MGSPSTSDVVVNEISDKGTSTTTCAGADWVELKNTGGCPVNISGHLLCDERGCDDNRCAVGWPPPPPPTRRLPTRYRAAELTSLPRVRVRRVRIVHVTRVPRGSYALPAPTVIQGGGYLVVCGQGVEDGFAWGIGGRDKISLHSPSGIPLATSGRLPGGGEYGK